MENCDLLNNKKQPIRLLETRKVERAEAKSLTSSHTRIFVVKNSQKSSYDSM